MAGLVPRARPALSRRAGSPAPARAAAQSLLLHRAALGQARRRRRRGLRQRHCLHRAVPGPAPAKGQRLISNSGSASMGYDLPAAIGAAFARPGKRVICIAGDGSIQMNIQELQTVVHHHLPVKIFVLNNSGYLSMRMTQTGFFGRLTGESASSGASLPDMVKVGCAYGIPSIRIDRAIAAGSDRSRPGRRRTGADRCRPRPEPGVRAALESPAVTRRPDRFTQSRGHVPFPR